MTFSLSLNKTKKIRRPSQIESEIHLMAVGIEPTILKPKALRGTSSAIQSVQYATRPQTLSNIFSLLIPRVLCTLWFIYKFYYRKKIFRQEKFKVFIYQENTLQIIEIIKILMLYVVCGIKRVKERWRSCTRITYVLLKLSVAPSSVTLW